MKAPYMLSLLINQLYLYDATQALILRQKSSIDRLESVFTCSFLYTRNKLMNIDWVKREPETEYAFCDEAIVGPHTL